MKKKRRQKTYSEKLSDRRWQERQQAIRNRDGMKCQINESHDGQLHVHHKYYERGADPWDYPDDALITLCAKCHWEHEELMDEIKYMAGMGGKAYMEEVLRFMKTTAANYNFGWVTETPLPPEPDPYAPPEVRSAFAKLKAVAEARSQAASEGRSFDQASFESAWEQKEKERTRPVEMNEARSAFAALRAAMGRGDR